MASLSYGNTSASSLIKSANSIAGEIATYNDSLAADTFANSLRTDGDLQTYESYLNGRISSLQSTGDVTDASKALSLNQTLISATNQSASANIQRSTIAVLDGQGTQTDKLNAIGNAFQQLYAVGDLDAAQTYESQYYSLFQTIQLAKQTAASALAASNSGSITDAIAKVQGQITDANYAFSNQGPSYLDKVSAQFLQSQGLPIKGVASIFSGIAGAVGVVKSGIQLNDNTKYAQGTYTPGSILDTYTQAIALDPSKAQTYQQDINDYIEGKTGISIPGGGSVTYNALMNTVYAGNNGTAPYEVVQNADGSYGVKAGNATGYVWGKDQNGATKLMPSYSFFTAPVAPGTQKALESAGINVKQDTNGDYWFGATTQGSFLNKVVGSNPVQGAVQKDGSVEFMSNGKLYSMVKDAKGLYGVQQVNQFGQVQNANVAGQYGFTPTKSEQAIGNSDFLTKTLGDSATPTVINGKTYYQDANGKVYLLATDAKGLKGLQEVDPKTGKVTNNNVSGQYGFNPNAPTKGTITSFTTGSGKVMNGPNFSDFTKLGANQLPTGQSPTVYSHEGISLTQMINNSQIINSINSAHNAAMVAIAPPINLPSISIAAPSTLPTIKIGTSPLAGLGVAVNPTPKTVNPQPAAKGTTVQNTTSGSGLQGGGTIRLQ